MVIEVPAEVLKRAGKCGHLHSCLRTGRCGDSPMCEVASAHGEDVLCVLAADWPGCAYHLDFGGARYCVCPVRNSIHRQKAA